MAKVFSLEILTPERTFFHDQAQAVVVTGVHGEMGFLAGAMPVVANLAPGRLRLQQAGKWLEAVTGEGFVTVTPAGVVVLVMSAEWPFEIKIKETEETIDRLTESMKKQQSLEEYKRAKAQLAREFARLRVKRRFDE